MHYADYKTILSPANGMNVYRGCVHGCIYCDSRSACYNMKHAFTDIEVKRDAAKILERQLKSRRHKAMINTGAMCDPYIPLEEELKVTRGCLEVIERYGFGVSLLTKSARILRDIDILKRINKQTKCAVQVTLTTFNEELCKKIEPEVSTTAERFRVLEVMREAGIPTVVWLSPVLPFINDTEENLLGILDYCARAKVKGIICFGFGVTLREGNREYFYSALDKRFPGVKQKYIRAFGNSYVCDSPNTPALRTLFRDFCRENGIAYNAREIFKYLRTLPEREEQLRFEV